MDNHSPTDGYDGKEHPETAEPMPSDLHEAYRRIIELSAKQKTLEERCTAAERIVSLCDIHHAAEMAISKARNRFEAAEAALSFLQQRRMPLPWIFLTEHLRHEGKEQKGLVLTAGSTQLPLQMANRVPFGHNYLGMVAECGHPLPLKNAVNLAPDGLPEIRSEGDGAVIAVPIRDGEEVRGIIAVSGPQESVTEQQSYDLLTCVSKALLLKWNNLRQAEYDSLTGLLTQMLLEPIGERELSYALFRRQDLAVVVTDKNGFKQVNDTWGHAAGSKVLGQAYGKMAANLRRSDFFFRYGGDEGCILLPNCDAEGAKIVAERLRKPLSAFSPNEYLAVNHPMLHDGKNSPDIRIDFAYGIATLSELASQEGSSWIQLQGRREMSPIFHELFNLADKRMYDMKRRMKRRAGDQ